MNYILYYFSLIDSLKKQLQNDQEVLKLIDKWYKQDNNSIPAVCVLQPISTYFPEYTQTQGESLYISK